MNQIRGIVIATVLAVWCFPAVGSARTWAPPGPWAESAAAASNTTRAVAADAAEATGLAAREARARELQDFRGGRVSVYIGSGVLTVVLVVLLIVLLV